MKELLLLKPGEKIILESKANKFREDKAVKGYMYLTNNKLLFVNRSGIIDFYLSINHIIGVCSTGGMFNKYLVVQYLYDVGRPDQILFKLKHPHKWVTAIHKLITSENK